MQCGTCNKNIKDGEDRELRGQIVCEDCYIDALSPVKPCDPWAVHCARSFQGEDGFTAQITETQSRILQILKQTGGLKLSDLSRQAELSTSELEREIATLRHMEKLRAEMREGEKIICLW